MTMAGLPKIPTYDLPTAADLPAPRGPWHLQAGRSALLIHDMQNYFTRAFVADAAPLAPAIANIAALADACRHADIPVFYTAQNGDQDRRDRGLQADLWGPGMRHIPEDQHIIPQLAPQPGDHVLVKHRYSAFQLSNLDHLLRVRGRDQLMITGIYAHIGCLMTAAEAFQRDIETFAIADAQADFTRAEHDMAMHWVAGRCGVAMTTQTAVNILKGA